MNIQINLDEKEALKLLSILTSIDPTSLFIGGLTSAIKSQVESQMKSEVKFVENKPEVKTFGSK